MFHWKDLSFPVKVIIIVVIVAIICGIIVCVIIWMRNKNKGESFTATNKISGDNQSNNVVAAFCQSWIDNIKNVVSPSKKIN